jgi:hypothetical protein
LESFQFATKTGVLRQTDEQQFQLTIGEYESSILHSPRQSPRCDSQEPRK